MNAIENIVEILERRVVEIAEGVVLTILLDLATELETWGQDPNIAKVRGCLVSLVQGKMLKKNADRT